MQESWYSPLAASGPSAGPAPPLCLSGRAAPRLCPALSPFRISCASSLSRFRLYVIICFVPDSVVSLCNRSRMLFRSACVRICVCIWACTLCKCRSFQTPIGVQSPNQLTAQVLILSAHKLLFLFLISNEHICRDICFFISFLSRPQEGMNVCGLLFFLPTLQSSLVGHVGSMSDSVRRGPRRHNQPVYGDVVF